MKEHYDFSRGQRGAIVTPPPNKQRITIRLDAEIIHWFKEQVHRAAGGNYQTLINDALQQHIRESNEALEAMLRRVLREELRGNRLQHVSEVAEPHTPYDAR